MSRRQVDSCGELRIFLSDVCLVRTHVRASPSPSIVVISSLARNFCFLDLADGRAVDGPKLMVPV